MSNRVIHEANRLRITATLAGLRPGEQVDFGFLKKQLGLSDGNLSAHLTVLERHGYIDVAKTFAGKKPRTLCSLTPAGRQAFGEHIDWLETIIKQP